MADRDGRHSEMITQLLRHVTSSPHDADVRGDIFIRTKSKSLCHSFHVLAVTEGPPHPVVEDQ